MHIGDFGIPYLKLVLASLSRRGGVEKVDRENLWRNERLATWRSDDFFVEGVIGVALQDSCGMRLESRNRGQKKFQLDRTSK